MSALDLWLRLGTAAVLGSLIGLDRQRLDKAAGLRTHMLVSVGSALVMIVSAHGFDNVLNPGRIVLDPSRVAAQVVSGVGFLGAGAILRDQRRVHGLTTAASIWAVAAVGLAAGGGMYLAASVATVIVLIILMAVKPFEDRLRARPRRHGLRILANGAVSLGDIEARAERAGVEILSRRARFTRRLGRRRFELTVAHASAAELTAFIDALGALEGVHDVDLDG